MIVLSNWTSSFVTTSIVMMVSNRPFRSCYSYRTPIRLHCRDHHRLIFSIGIVSHVSITECVRQLTWSVFGRYIWWVRVPPSTIFIFQVFFFLSNHQTIHGLMIHTTPRFARRQSRRSRVNQFGSKIVWYPLWTLTNILRQKFIWYPLWLFSIFKNN